MPQGKIKMLSDKGFGFITATSGQDIFFHSTNLDGVRYEEQRQSQHVTYTEGRGP